MNPGLALGSAVFAGTALLHALLGIPDVAAPIDAAPLGAEVRATAMVVWHMITWHFLLVAVGLALLAAGRLPAKGLVWGTAAMALGDGALFVAMGMARFGSVDVLPQWVLFAVALAALAWGLVRWRPV